MPSKKINQLETRVLSATDLMLVGDPSTGVSFKSLISGLGSVYVPNGTTLTINGTTLNLTTNRSWSVGTVTSVNMSVPTGLTISGNPITNAGTLALGLASGYSIPTTANQANWNTAYNDSITSASVSGTSTKTLTLNQQDGGIIQASWSDLNTDAVTSVFGRTGAVIATNGDYTTSQVTEATNLYFTGDRVRATLLTGLNLVGGGTIAATDSILQAFGKTQNQISALVGGVMYEGVWNASTNSPSISSGVGSKGDYYVVSVAGSTNIDGISDWKVGDWIIFNGTTWDNVDNTDAVSSVNGFTGAVSLTTANISEVTNLYFTDSRVMSAMLTGYTIGSNTAITFNDSVLTAFGKAQAQINTKQNIVTLTTTGSSGSATFVSDTLNVPTYTLAGLGGQPQLNGTGFVKISGTTISYDNSTYYLASNPNSFIALTALSAGTGISYSNTTGVITNTAPDQVVSLSAGSGISVSGTYPSFTIASTITQYTDALARLAISESATGLDYNNTTGVFSLTSGYVIPTTTSATNWDAAYNDKINSAAVTGTTTKTLTLNQQDGGTITASWTDDNTDAVTSVFGRTGVVTAQSGDYTTTQVTEGTNLYYTDARARAAITLTTTGSSGASTYSGGTLNIPIYSLSGLGGVPTSRTITINGTTQDLSADRSWTIPVHDAVTIGTANGLSLSTQVLSLGLSSSSANGALSSTDWSTFNGKQNTITLTTTGTSGAATLVGATLNIPQYADQFVGTVTSVAALTLGTTGTDLSSTVANGTTTPVITLNVPTASATNRGALSSGDWTIFNNKQAALNGTGFVKISGTTISYDNTSYLPLTGGTLTSSSASETLRLVNSSTGYGLYVQSDSYFQGDAFFQSVSNTILKVNSSNKIVAAVAGTDYQAPITNPVTGTGTTNYLPKWTSGSALGNSLVYEDTTNIGINTSSPTGFGSTYTVLDVYNTNSMLMARSAAGIIGQINAANTDALYIGTRSNHKVYLTTNNTNAVTILATGEVGIGTTTPAGKLTVAESVNSGTANVLYLSNPSQTGVTAAAINFINADSFVKASIVAAVYGNDYMTFNVGSNTERMRINASGMVGIGTTSPAVKLDVVGDIRGQEGRFYNPSATNEYTYIGLSSTAVYLGTAQNKPVNFYNNNTERLRIDTSGNMGLGVVPSAWGSSFKSFQFGNTGAIWNNGSNNTAISHNAIFQDASTLYIQSGPASYYRQLSGEHNWFTAPSGTAGNAISFTQAMTLDASGRLGLGTTSPGARLQVNTSDFTSSIFVTTQNTNYVNIVNSGGQSYIFGTGNDIGFATSSSVTERLRITSGGNLLLGTTTDNNKFDLQVANKSTIVATGSAINVNYSGSTTGQYQTIGFSWDSSIGNRNSYWGMGFTGTSFGSGTGDLFFFTNGNTRLTIASTGAAEFSSTIKTAAPTGGTAKPIKFGAIQSGSSLTGDALQVEVDGVFYLLGIVGSP